ncbi:hypothetical protein D3C77_582380 [compost metagenome]
MHQHFLAPVGQNTNRMLAREYIEYFTINRGTNRTFMWQYCKSITRHFLRKHWIGNFSYIQELTACWHNDLFFDNRLALLGCLLFNLSRFIHRSCRNNRWGLTTHYIANLGLDRIRSCAKNGLNIVANFKNS